MGVERDGKGLSEERDAEDRLVAREKNDNSPPIRVVFPFTTVVCCQTPNGVTNAVSVLSVISTNAIHAHVMSVTG